MLQWECFGVVSFPSGVKSIGCTEMRTSCLVFALKWLIVSLTEELNRRLNGSDLAIVCFPNALLAFCC